VASLRFGDGLRDRREAYNIGVERPGLIVEVAVAGERDACQDELTRATERMGSRSSGCVRSSPRGE
jgi:hypothetical protein